MTGNFKSFVVRHNNERYIIQMLSLKAVLEWAKEKAEHTKSEVHISTMDGALGIMIPAHISENGKFIQTHFHRF